MRASDLLPRRLRLMLDESNPCSFGRGYQSRSLVPPYTVLPARIGEALSPPCYGEEPVDTHCSGCADTEAIVEWPLSVRSMSLSCSTPPSATVAGVLGSGSRHLGQLLEAAVAEHHHLPRHIFSLRKQHPQLPYSGALSQACSLMSIRVTEGSFA